MRMTWLITASLSFFVLSERSRAGEPIALRVLYAGNPGSDRDKDFTTFLGKSFSKVATTDYRTFKQVDAKGYDVVILDWTSIYSRDDQGKIKPGPQGSIRPRRRRSRMISTGRPS